MTHFTSPKCHALVTSPVGLLSLKASEHGLTHLQVEDLAQTSSLVEIQTQFRFQQGTTETTQDLVVQAQQHIDRVLR